ncbi:putative calcium-binding protein CML19 [Asparagus officinalis]|uniref:putative calcium-binding protein CML19 n=1 Tax=Asparagus officinalis TaxID=4686 RepID=UPI00098E7437|nr:putative calcium-binding protein CML19 [Asparagus officinalis]
MASYLANFEQIFTRFDANGDGKLSPSELQCLLRSISQELSLEEAEAVVESSDSDGDGLLDINEFAKFVGDKSETEEEERELREAYEMFVMKEEGHITAKSLKRMLSRLGTSKAIEECMSMICRFDGNGDGVLSFDEFKVMI